MLPDEQAEQLLALLLRARVQREVWLSGRSRLRFRTSRPSTSRAAKGAKTGNGRPPAGREEQSSMKSPRSGELQPKESPRFQSADLSQICAASDDFKAAGSDRSARGLTGGIPVGFKLSAQHIER